MTGLFIQCLFVAIPFAGALVCLACWSDPYRVKMAAIVGSVISLVSTVGIANRLPAPPDGFLPLYLLPIAAVVSALGQPVHQSHRLSWITTMVFLGLGMGALTAGHPWNSLCVITLMLIIMLLLYHHHTTLWPISWWGIGCFGVGVVGAGLSLAAGPPISAVASLATCAVLLPLMPFHDGYLTALTRLPGSLPSFIVLILPVLGLHGLAVAMPAMPNEFVAVVSLLALLSSLYGAVKALAQSRVRLLVGYGSVSFFSILWWFVAGFHTATPRATVLAGAVGLATGGLLVAWQVIRTRYGDDVDPQAISGLSAAMPKYAVLLSLLGLAAMGIPPFGVFAGFMGLLLTAPPSSTIGLFIALTAWLAASWYIMQMVQQLLFGARRADLLYTDLRHPEFNSLLIVVLALLALGLAPTSLYAPDQASNKGAAMVQSLSWNR
ncbi:MAG TPA: proton-conducting transporter membrane subunit [Nitrospira sp.]|jgi:NADH-quinone oxidoreductase subunit M|nr:proton-conducting transporter membrane subunit [Nitrospira sp.]